MQIASPNKFSLLLYVCLLIEFLFITFLRNTAGPYISPILFFLASMGICAAAFFYFLDAPAFLLQQPETNSKTYRNVLIVIGIVAGGIILNWLRLQLIIGKTPLDAEAADVIPAIQVNVQRLLNNEPVYTLVTHLKKRAYFPTYLPMQWLPFVVPEYFGVDYRYMAFLIMLAGFGFYYYYLLRLSLSLPEIIIKAALPFVILLILFKHDANFYGHTVETMIIGYHFMLVAGILSRSVWLRGISIILILLSRYSFLFWLPFYALIVFFRESKSRAIQISLIVLAGIILLYVVPFLSKDWLIFTKGQAYYTESALTEWVTPDWADKPFHLFRGIGFASYFYTFGPESLVAKIAVIRKVHLVMSVLAVVVAALVYRRYKNRIDERIFSLLSLKFYLVIFYAFIHVPYSYLTWLSVFLSLWILLIVTWNRIPAQANAALPSETIL